MNINSLSEDRVGFLERLIQESNKHSFKKVISCASDNNEMAYILTSFTQDWVRLSMMNLNNQLPSQEAKAAMKVILDTVLLDYGLHVRIDEFDKPS